MIRRFFKDAGFSGAAEVLIRLKGLVIMPLLTYHLGTVSYGAWSQVLVLVGILGPFVTLATESGFMRHAAGHPIEVQKRYFSGWLLYILVNASIVAGSLAVVRSYTAEVFFGDATTFAPFVLLASAILYFTAILNTARYWFLLRHSPRVYVVASVTQSALGVVAVIVTLIRKEGVYELVAYTLVGDVLLAAALFALIARRGEFTRPDLTIIRPALRFGLPLIPGALAVWALNMMDRLFLVHFASLADIGVYSLAYTLGYTVIPVLARPLRMMYPSIATAAYNQGRKDDLQRIFNYSAGAVLALTLPATVGMFVLGAPIVSILAPPEFASAAPLIGLVALGYVFMTMASYFELHLGFVFRQHWFSMSVIAAGLANFVLNLVLIPRYGILGAAIATTASFALQFLISLAVSQFQPLVRIDLVFIAKVMAASLIMGAIIIGLRILLFTQGANAYIEIVSIVVLGITVYCSVMYLIGAIPTEKLSILRGLMVTLLVWR